MACPDYETLTGYTSLLERHGFVDIEAHDMSEDYAGHYGQAMRRLIDAEDWISKTYSARVFAIVVEKNSYALNAFEKGQIGGGHFLARLPETSKPARLRYARVLGSAVPTILSK